MYLIESQRNYQTEALLVRSENKHLLQHSDAHHNSVFTPHWSLVNDGTKASISLERGQ
jgi:hypothetical protein